MNTVAKSSPPPSLSYLSKEALLILLLSFFTLVGTSYKGAIVFETRLVTHMLVAVILGSWLGYKALAHEGLPSTSLDIPISALLLVQLLVTLFSDIPRLSLEGLLWTATYVMLFYLVIDLLRQGWPTDLFVKSLLVVGGIACLLAALEALAWYGNWLAIGGLADPIPPSTFRLTKTLGWANLLSSYLNLVIPLAVVSLVGAKRRFNRLVLVGWLLLALTVQFLTSSRGGWLGLFAAISTLAVMLLVQHFSAPGLLEVGRRITRRKVLTGVIVAGVLIASLPLAQVGYRLLQHPSHGGSDISHLNYWRSAWSAFLSRPITGTGLWTYGTQFLRFGGAVPLPPVEKAHNNVLMILAESGILGLAASGWMLVALSVALKRSWSGADREQRLLIAACVAGLVGFLAHGLVDDFLTFPLIMLNLVIVVALALGKRAPQERLLTRTIPARWLVVPVLIFMAVLLWTDLSYYDFSRGANLATEGDWGTGAGLIVRAVNLDPAFPFYRFQLAFAYGQLASQTDAPYLELAVGEYETALNQEPHYALNHANLAALYWQSGQPGTAIDSAQRAVELAPRIAIYSVQLGSYYEGEGADAEAMSLFKTALDLDPALAHDLFWEQSELRREFISGQRNTNASNKPSSLLQRGQGAYNAGQYDEAITLFETAVATQPGNSQAYLRLGQAHLAAGDDEAAMHDLQIARFLGARKEAHLVLGRSAYDRGDLTRAMAEFEAALVKPLYSDGYGPAVYRREGIYQSQLPQMPRLGMTASLLDSFMQLAEIYEEADAVSLAREVYLMLLEWLPGFQPALQKLELLQDTGIQG